METTKSPTGHMREKLSILNQQHPELNQALGPRKDPMLVLLEVAEEMKQECPDENDDTELRRRTLWTVYKME